MALKADSQPLQKCLNQKEKIDFIKYQINEVHYYKILQYPSLKKTTKVENVGAQENK
jgi:hypothetical protein